MARTAVLNVVGPITARSDAETNAGDVSSPGCILGQGESEGRDQPMFGKLRTWLVLSASLLVTGSGCVHGLKTLPRDDNVHQYVYAKSVDETLGQATNLLEEQGYVVLRSGNSLGTTFVTDAKGETVGVRVDAEEIDVAHTQLRVERLVLTTAPLRSVSD